MMAEKKTEKKSLHRFFARDVAIGCSCGRDLHQIL